MAVTLQINGEYASGTPEVVYYDALVDEGTLFIHDYSNRGTLVNFNFQDGSIARDLARQISLPIGIDNSTELVAASGTTPELTAGRGINIRSFVNSSNTTGPHGFDLGGDMCEYLYNNQPETLFIAWVRFMGNIEEDPVNNTGPIIQSAHSSDPQAIYLANNQIGNPILHLAGVSAGSYPVGTIGNLAQVAVHFKGAGTTMTRFMDGENIGESVNDATGFPDGYDFLNIGGRTQARPNTNIYRVLVADLTLSPLTAEEIVKKDWEYCNGTGQYSGRPTRRPFIDVV